MIVIFIHLLVTYRQTNGCKAIYSAWHLNLHRYRWQVRFWLYTMHMRLARRGANPQRHRRARFTAFVSYCKEDSNFVLTKVSETLASVCSAERAATSCLPRSVKHIVVSSCKDGNFVFTQVSKILTSMCQTAKRTVALYSPRSVEY